METFILAVIAILLVILFVWLLLREQGERTVVEQATGKKPVVAETRMTEPAPAPIVIEPEHKPVSVAAPQPAAAEVDATEASAAVPAEAVPPAREHVMAEPAAQPVEPRSVEPPVPAAVPPVAPEMAPPVIDDLEIIEGIGPKIAAVLKQAGITSFAQLAEMAPARIDEILHAANLRLADPRSWPEQARLAAAGDQAGLKALQDRLKGGREE